MKKEVKGKLLKSGIVKPHEAEFVIKDLSVINLHLMMNPKNKFFLKYLNTVVACGEDNVINLWKNNGMKPKFEEFWQYYIKSGVP